MSFLPSRCRRYLEEHGLIYEEAESGGQKGLILKQFALPKDKFDSAGADILILLPPGYPDAPPDMFYTMPWLRLVPGNRCPRAANLPIIFKDLQWQRWSRHNNAWRPGVDGIWTMVKRIETALKEAA